VRGGLQAGLVKNSAYGPAVSEPTRQHTEEIKAQLMAGNLSIFKGPLQSNTGQTVIPVGVSLAQTDLSIEKMDWLVEGVLGSTS
jgi:simple sugar transport system substrate-binding protein